ASVGAMEGDGVVSARDEITGGRLSTYERPRRPGFVKLAANRARRVLVGAVAVGPEAGEWRRPGPPAARGGGAPLRRATCAPHRRPLPVRRDEGSLERECADSLCSGISLTSPGEAS